MKGHKRIVAALLTLALFGAGLTLTVNVLTMDAAAYSGSIYAVPNPVASSASVTVYCSYSAFSVSTSVAPAGECVVDGSYLVYESKSPSGSGSKTFAPGTFPAGSHTMTVYYATSYNVKTHYYTYGSVSATLTVTSGTYITGQVVLGDPVSFGATSTGLYGATVSTVSGGVTVTGSTDSTGTYTLPVSGAGTYTVTVSATGFCAYPARDYPYSHACTRGNGLTSSVSVPVSTSGTTVTAPRVPMFMHTTYDAPQNLVWWELADSCTNGGLVCTPYVNSNGIPVSFTLYSYYNSGGYPSGSYPAASIVSTSAESLTGNLYTPLSGATHVIKLAGTDTSAAGTGDAYAYLDLSGVNVALTAPSMLTFYVLDMHTPASHKGPVSTSTSSCNQRSSLDQWTILGNGMVSIDARFSDGTKLSTVQDSNGGFIKDGNGVRVAPGYDQYLVNGHFPNSAWYRVTVDLSELRYKTITDLQFAYDNCGNGGSVSGSSDSYFQVYFDDVRLEMARPPANIPNAGFELPNLQSWGVGGNPKPQVAQGVAPTIAPSADTYVNTYYPNMNSGTGTYLTGGTNAINIFRIYTKWNLQGTVPLGSHIAKATLQLYMYAWAYGSSLTDGQLYYVSDNSWTETGITWNNQPASTTWSLRQSGISFSTIGQWYSFDVTSDIQNALNNGNWVVSFMLKRATESFVEEEPLFASKENSNSAIHPKLVIASNPVVDGVNSAFLGSSVAGSASDSYLYQSFRVPYDANYFAPSLSFFINPHTTDPCLCTTANWVKVYLMDRTTLQTLPAMYFTNSNSGTWSSVSTDMSHYAGHIFWLVIQVHEGGNGYATWAYFDDVNLLPDGASMYNNGYNVGGNQYNIQMSLNSNIYLPSSATLGTLPISFSGYTPAPFSGGGMALALDLHQFNHLYSNGGTLTDLLDFSASAFIVVPRFQADPLNSAVEDGYAVMGAKVQVSVSGTTTATVSLVRGYTDGLTGAGNSNVDPVDLLLTGADGLLTAADFIPGVGEVTAVPSAILYGITVAYGMYKFFNPTTVDPTTAYQEAIGGCTTCLPYQIGTHGGETVYANAYLGTGTGGSFIVTVTVTATVSPVACVVNSSNQWQCYNPAPLNPYVWTSVMALSISD